MSAYSNAWSLLRNALCLLFIKGALFQVTAKTDYALLVMVALADRASDSAVSLRQLAEEKSLPYAFLSQIVAPLRNAGLVESREGVGGGYKLTRDPNKIPIGDIIRAIDGNIAIVRCMQHEKSHCDSKGACGLPPFWNTVSAVLSKTFDGMTLADLQQSNRQPITSRIV